MEPQMRSVSRLWLALDYTALRGMEVHMVARVVLQMLRRFPCLNFLTIEVRVRLWTSGLACMVV
jgi:hypothetical protein